MKKTTPETVGLDAIEANSDGREKVSPNVSAPPKHRSGRVITPRQVRQLFVDARREAATEMRARITDVFNSLDRVRTLGERLGLDDPSDLAVAWERATRGIDGLAEAISEAVKR